MIKTAKVLVLGLFISFLGSLVPTAALAYTPIFSVNSNGNGGATLTISNSSPYSPITLYIRQTTQLWTVISNFGQTDASGYFSQNDALNTDGTNNPFQLYVVVGGQQSAVVQMYPNSYTSGCSYNCGSPTGLSLSQNNVSLSVGQSITVTANNNNNYYTSSSLYISGNSSPNVASASASGSSIYIYGLASGSTSISVCGNSSNQCATIYVSVSGYNGCTYNCGGSGTLLLSQTSVSLNANQSSTVTVSNYNGSPLYISGNTNPNAVSASLSGSVINLYGLNVGYATLTICASNSSLCASLYITVNGNTTVNTNSVSVLDSIFSPRVITVAVGSSVVWTNLGGMSHTVTADDNSFDSGTLIPGANFSKTFYTAGTYAYHCKFHGTSGGGGMSGIVIVTGNANNGQVTFSQTNPTLNIGQTLAITMYSNNNYSNGFYISGNTNPGAITSSISGNALNLYGQNSGNSTITVCQSSGSSVCGSLTVTVNGNNYSSGSLYFSGLTLPQVVSGQYYSYQLQANGGTPPYYYYLTSGSLPSGLSLSPNGLISGVAYSPSYASFSVRANDNYGRSATATFTLNGTSYSYGNNGGGLLYPGGVLGASAYASGQLISENGTVYIVYKNTKTAFASAWVFHSFGFNFSNILNVGNSGLQTSGYVIGNANTSHPWGSWIKSGSTIYFVSEFGLIPVPDWGTFINNGGQSNLVVPANVYDFRAPMLGAMSGYDSRLH